MSDQINYPNEQWKEYHDEVWEDSYRYLISNYGRIKGLKVSKHYKKTVKGSITNGYITIFGKTSDGKTRNRYLHKIVAELFVTKRTGATMVIHKDFNYKNNRATNLKWANKNEKAQHQMRNPNIDNINNNKLTETQVIRLKRILHDPNRKTRYKIIARQFGVSEMQLHRIKTGENWGHVNF